MPIEVRQCAGCGHKYDVLVDGAKQYGMDRRGGLLGCPRCKSEEYEKKIGRANPIKLGGDAGVGRIYPYFDRALGCEVRDHQHRDHLMTHYNDEAGTPREVKLEPTDGAVDFAGWVATERAEAEEDEAVYNEVMAEQAEGPNRAEYGKLADMIEQGWMPPALEDRGGESVPEVVTPAVLTPSDVVTAPDVTAEVSSG